AGSGNPQEQIRRGRKEIQFDEAGLERMAKSYTTNISMHTAGGRSFYSWTVLDPVGNRVKFGNTRSRAEAVLAAEKAIWRLQQTKPPQKPLASLWSIARGVLPWDERPVLSPSVLCSGGEPDLWCALDAGFLHRRLQVW